MNMRVPPCFWYEGEGQHLEGGHDNEDWRHQDFQGLQGAQFSIHLPGVGPLEIPLEGRRVLARGDACWPLLVLHDHQRADGLWMLHIHDDLLLARDDQKACRPRRIQQQGTWLHRLGVPHLHGLRILGELHSECRRNARLVDIQHATIMPIDAQRLDVPSSHFVILRPRIDQIPLGRHHANQAFLESPHADDTFARGTPAANEEQ
mmetsp:Transcript_74867/g.146976  ORF Transcript_74867/g.146976 Transcript_74867/m.146976 type:complete len:205 (-) Transcript_74867:35-649(-)